MPMNKTMKKISFYDDAIQFESYRSQVSLKFIRGPKNSLQVIM